jgi:hypothetical protein
MVLNALVAALPLAARQDIRTTKDCVILPRKGRVEQGGALAGPYAQVSRIPWTPVA